MHMISTLNAAVTSQVCEAKHLTALWLCFLVVFAILHSNLEMLALSGNYGSNSDRMWRHWKICSMELSSILKVYSKRSWTNAKKYHNSTDHAEDTLNQINCHETPRRTTLERRKGSLEVWLKFTKQNVETHAEPPMVFRYDKTCI